MIEEIENSYVVFIETNNEKNQTWYTFIRKDGNENSLLKLQIQLSQIDWYSLKDLSIFKLDLDNTVSEKTAREMCSINLNLWMFHKKFDGEMKDIDFAFKKSDSNEKRIEKVFDTLGYGQIQEYLSNEEVCDIKISENYLSSCIFSDDSTNSDIDENIYTQILGILEQN